MPGMAKPKKDIPLLLRRRAVKRDGAGNAIESALYLDARPGEKPVWPPRHEFSTDWLLKTPEASVDGDSIGVNLANGWAVYKIVESVEIDGEIRVAGTSSMWAELVTSEVS